MVINLYSCFIFFFIYFISIHFIRSVLSKSRTPIRLPPSPISLPIIGHFFHLRGRYPHRVLQKLSNRYGPLMHFRVGAISFALASSSETVQEIFKTHDLSFSNRPLKFVTRHLAYDSPSFAFSPYGPQWKLMKKICMNELLNGHAIERSLPIRREELQEFLRALLKMSESRGLVNVIQELTKLTNNVIGRIAINRCSSDDEEAKEVRMLVREMSNLIGSFDLADYFGFLRFLDLQGIGRRVKAVREKFDVMIERIIEEHEVRRREKMEIGDEGHYVKDIVDILLEILDDNKSEVKLSRESIKAVLRDMFTGGTDAPAVAIEWALAELINHPNMLEKAREEINHVVGKSRLIEESDVPQLPYLQAIVAETMRLHPPSPVTVRESFQDCKIGVYDIPANTWVLINIWAIGRDPKNWEDPLEYRPERFMDYKDKGHPNNTLYFKGQNFDFLPFGVGRRACPGASFALQIVHATLAAMIQCFEWKLNDDGKETTIDMTEGVGLTLPRAHPLICVPIARSNLLTILDM